MGEFVMNTSVGGSILALIALVYSSVLILLMHQSPDRSKALVMRQIVGQH